MTVENKSEESNESKAGEAASSHSAPEADIKWREKFKQSKAELEQEKSKASEEIKRYEEKISTVYKAVEKRVIDAELKAIAISAGLQDLDFLQLIDISAIKLDENGSVEGLEKAVNDFKAKKPLLFGAEKKVSSSKNEKFPSSEEKTSEFNAFEMTDDQYRAKKNEMFGSY